MNTLETSKAENKGKKSLVSFHNYISDISNKIKKENGVLCNCGSGLYIAKPKGKFGPIQDCAVCAP